MIFGPTVSCPKCGQRKRTDDETAFFYRCGSVFNCGEQRLEQSDECRRSEQAQVSGLPGLAARLDNSLLRCTKEQEHQAAALLRRLSECFELEREVERLQALNAGLADRVAAQSELLSKRAEK